MPLFGCPVLTAVAPALIYTSNPRLCAAIVAPALFQYLFQQLFRNSNPRRQVLSDDQEQALVHCRRAITKIIAAAREVEVKLAQVCSGGGLGLGVGGGGRKVGGDAVWVSPWSRRSCTAEVVVSAASACGGGCRCFCFMPVTASQAGRQAGRQGRSRRMRGQQPQTHVAQT